MRYAFFKGCKIPYYQPGYEDACRSVLGRFNVELADLRFTCCGYPVRQLDQEAFLLTAMRNLAMAEKEGLDILTPCKCCYGSLRHAMHRLAQDPAIVARLNRELAAEGLAYTGRTKVRHLLQVLKDDVGPDVIKKAVTRPLKGLKVAVHYGCHALRPAAVTDFDNPVTPTIFEEVVAASGATVVPWSRRLECCGNPLAEKSPELSERIMRRKMESAAKAGADLLITACTYCQMQFETGVEQGPAAQDKTPPLPILLPQILGLALEFPENRIGLSGKIGLLQFVKDLNQARVEEG